MDLILLQPGDPKFLGGVSVRKGKSAPHGGASLSDAKSLPACLELVSLHHGMTLPLAPEKSPATRPKVRPVLTEFTCVKYVDGASAKLYEHCLAAKPLGRGAKQPTLLHVLRNSGDQTVPVLTFSLRDALVTEVQFQTHPDDMPTEQFKLSFTEILWTYASRSADGTPTRKTTAGWSITRNRSIRAFTG